MSGLVCIVVDRFIKTIFTLSPISEITFHNLHFHLISWLISLIKPRVVMIAANRKIACIINRFSYTSNSKFQQVSSFSRILVEMDTENVREIS